MVDDRLMHVLWYQNRVGSGAQGGFKRQIFEILVHARMSDPRSSLAQYAGVMEANGITLQEIENKVARIEGRAPTVLEPAAQKDEPSGKGNCLIIPLLGKWESIRLLNTYDTPNLLEDISKSLVMPIPDNAPRSLSIAAGFGGTGGGIVFLQFDIYDIVLAERAADIPAVLAQINPQKRPEVNDAVFGMLDRWYMCPVAVCCFNGSQSGEAKPLGFGFEPLYPDKLVVYTLDGHDGKPPDPTKLVKVDHDIFVGSYLMKAASHARVSYSDNIPAHLNPYVLRDILGVQIKDKRMENGDFVFSTEQVRKGFFQGLRSLPPMAPAGLPRLGHMAVREYAYVSDERSPS
ncbi:MAG: hypothetical protein IT342_18405 [Candidatus Melainabacteria bacterium]|nr:hypothetical protein [Candidatus Melainabacteria bacterium]